jgi:dipeptidase E
MISDRTGPRDAVIGAARDGLPYMGAGAATNRAAPTLRTIDDMPVVQPPSFETLGLVPFRINPHCLDPDPDPDSTHKDEPREQRLTEFLEENDVPVLGLREGSWLRVDGRQTRVRGARPARLFTRGAEPRELPVGPDVPHPLTTAPRFDAPVR